VDVLVTPVWPYPLPTIAESDVGVSPGAAAMVLRSGHNTRPINYLGFPAVNIPTGFDANGLPMSVQLIGAPFSEARLLRVARALERELDFWSARPELDAVTE
jgi:aspartyl-tRNA(Asn)/glutamyl-tRNA(Gln) amidotransferase subunit A